ncbi:MAG: TolC family protein [Bacteroidales bacterium]|jgi:outer membrane protein TolC|nr:TolC family protein [Bacteroidales bacterium]
MNRIFLIFVSLVLSAASLTAQEEQQVAGPKYVFTLEDVVLLAKQQSPNAIMARHRFRASYFSYMSYKANFLPKLTFTTNPATYDHSIRTIQSVDNAGNLKITEAEANTFTSTGSLDLSQNIGFTGGTISLGSNFSRIQNLDDDSDFGTQFTTSPVRLSLEQPLNGYNQYKWLKKIEPLRYDEAKQNYIAQMETVSSNAVNYFFALALAQVSLNMAQTNYTNSKTLYEISQGRYQIGTIAEDALLQMELKYMQAESKLNRARIDIEAKQSQLRSFLGFKDNVEIVLEVDSKVPGLKVPYNKALEYALERSPEIISYNRQILEAERTVAQTKSQKGVTMTLDGSFGLNKTGYKFKDAYSSPYDDREGVSIGIRVPILDWSQAKNSYRNAQSLLEVIETQMKQNETDFQQDVYLQIMTFNMQENQLRIAAKADTIAKKGYDVSYQRYLIGKVSVTDLNIADADKDNAKMSYMTELQSYWNLYYTVRRLTLFDFVSNKPLEEDFDTIIGE